MKMESVPCELLSYSDTIVMNVKAINTVATLGNDRTSCILT